MALQVSFATINDVERIADIHLTAFDSNPLLHVQFPTPTALAALKTILQHDMLRTIQRGEACGRIVLVVRDESIQDKVISFAKWDLPTLTEDDEIHPDVQWPADCQSKYLDEYHALAAAMKQRVLKSQKCYRMTFVGTDPSHRGKGAATRLTEWGLERAEKEDLPVYLEATAEAVSLYQKLGLIKLDELTLPLPANSNANVVDERPNVYQELGMLRTWKSETESVKDSPRN